MLCVLPHSITDLFDVLAASLLFNTMYVHAHPILPSSSKIQRTAMTMNRAIWEESVNGFCCELPLSLEGGELLVPLTQVMLH